jgi:ubiquinone/menaquinone biosynthesis C-methylase UbiE
MTDNNISDVALPSGVPADLTSDFSPIASRYDATRDVPEQCLVACYDRLMELGLFPTQGVILDAGCGTGQISLPLAARRYEIHGIDISDEMISLAQSKVQPEWRAHYTVGDVRKISYNDQEFDAVVVSKLFQHVQDWKRVCRELIRVVRSGSYVVQINERGAFGNSVRRYFSRRADELGFAGRYVGLNPHSDVELSSYMLHLGCDVVSVDMSGVQWETSISYDEAIIRIQEKLFAEFWYLPADVHDQIVADTIAWVEAQPKGHRTTEKLKPYLVVETFRTPLASKT